VRDGTSELAVAALEALLEEAGAAPGAFAAHYRPRLTWLQGFLGHADAAGARAARRAPGQRAGAARCRPRRSVSAAPGSGAAATKFHWRRRSEMWLMPLFGELHRMRSGCPPGFIGLAPETQWALQEGACQATCWSLGECCWHSAYRRAH